jgi:hypothetical protein
MARYENSMKEIEIIPLARRKMAKRGIPQAWAGDALRRHDQVVAGMAAGWSRSSGAKSAPPGYAPLARHTRCKAAWVCSRK